MLRNIYILASLLLVGCVSNSSIDIPTSPLDNIESSTKVDEYIYYNENEHLQDSIWDEIVINSKIAIPTDNEEYQQILNRYIGNQTYFDKIARNGEPYLFYIVSELKKRNMPIELALLPAVESDYDPFALSSTGAFGMWQFMLDTANFLDLENNWWFEGRKDVIFSTNRALDYLQAMYDKLGDWNLVIAAYNGGIGRVLRAVAKNKEAGLSTDFWDLGLPKETTEYLPKLLALLDIIKNPVQYGIYLPYISNEPYFRVIIYEEQVSLIDLSASSGISLDELSILNPGYNHWITMPENNKFLLVPKEKFVESYLFLNTNLEKSTVMQRFLLKDESELNNYAIYDSFIKVNDINYMRKNLQKGNAVVAIIDTPKVLEYSEEDVYANDLEQFTKINLKNSKTTTHTVKEGDTLWSITRSYGISLKDIQVLNGLEEDDSLQIGMKLIVDFVPTKKVVFNSFESNYNRMVIRTISYNNRKGDSLLEVSKKLGFRIDDLVLWNPQLRGALSRKDDTILITVDVNKKNGLL